jgi:hypothetical protein
MEKKYHLIKHYKYDEYWIWEKDTPHPAWADANFSKEINGIKNIANLANNLITN